MIDVHCHLLPNIDDGASSLADAVEMAQIAAADGITTVITTPHQLGRYRHNRAATIRRAARDFQQHLCANHISLTILPGADVRIETDLIEQLDADEVLTLADQKRHILLELPHEVYFPISHLLRQLETRGITGILSHPERNQGILAEPNLVAQLVDEGCLMQVTGSSLTGGFGPRSQQLAEQLVRQGCVHLIASDGHSPRSRRPHLSRARRRVAELTSEENARVLTEVFPQRVAQGMTIPSGRQHVHSKPTRRRWLKWRSNIS